MVLVYCLIGVVDLGVVEVLVCYVVNCKLDCSGIIGIIDGLICIFSNDDLVFKYVCGVGLIVLDLLLLLCSFFVCCMMFGVCVW